VDLLAIDLPDGRNIADDYLRRHGWKGSVSTREYIAGLRRSVISIDEVSGLVPGESMLLRDLVRGGAPIRVWEKRGSEGLRLWGRGAAAVKWSIGVISRHADKQAKLIHDRHIAARRHSWILRCGHHPHREEGRLIHQSPRRYPSGHWNSQ
jgi:hypothetical protein